jgi:ParB family chromosome partitioning protein
MSWPHPIAANGLINNLVVKPHKKDSFTVIAAGRRLAALQLLVKNGALPADHPVKCEVLADKANALELSLAENAVREQMHPPTNSTRFAD